jgi:hypothetical protein
MTKLNTIRVYGGLVNSDESYVDYDVVGVTENGGIHLQNVNDSTDTIIWSDDELSQAFDDDLAVDGDNIPIPSDGSWDALDTLTGLRQFNNGDYYNNFSQNKLGLAQKSLFLAIVEQSKDMKN